MVISAIAVADGAFRAFQGGTGARALGMGGAFVAVADDATAIQWNPAGLALFGDTRLGGMSTDRFGVGVTHQYIGAVTTLAGFGLGFGWERLSIDSMVVDAVGAPGQAFTWSESVLIGTIASDLLGFGLVGVNIKYYTADSGLGSTATGFGFDLGLLISVGETVTIGVNATDIAGTTITWDTGVVNTVDAVYTAGAAMTLLEGTMLMAGDIDFTDAGLGDARIGLEFQVIPELAIRGGVVLTDAFQEFQFTVGAGIAIAGLYVDAAYLLDEVLGNTLILSAEFSFGELFPVVEEEPAE